MIIPPEIIAGEAAICTFHAMLAVAWVYSRNPRFYGWSDEPGRMAQWIARYWYLFPDPTRGATNLFSAADLKQEKVRRLIAGRPVRAIFG